MGGQKPEGNELEEHPPVQVLHALPVVEGAPCWRRAPQTGGDEQALCTDNLKCSHCIQRRVLELLQGVEAVKQQVWPLKQMHLHALQRLAQALLQ